MIRGDGLLRIYDYAGRRRARETLYQFRLALKDDVALDRTADYLSAVGVVTRRYVFQKETEERAGLHAIRTSSRGAFYRISEVISWPKAQLLTGAKAI